MEDGEREPRAMDRAAEQSDDQQAQEAPAAIVARLLANPRRIRRT